MIREFIYLPEFEKQWAKCGLDDNNQRELEAFLCEHPEAGNLIKETGGLRKLRWSLPGKGKSSSSRVLYVDFAFFEKIYFLSCFPKSVKVSLSRDEKKSIKAVINDIKATLRREKL